MTAKTRPAPRRASTRFGAAAAAAAVVASLLSGCASASAASAQGEPLTAISVGGAPLCSTGTYAQVSLLTRTQVGIKNSREGATVKLVGFTESGSARDLTSWRIPSGEIRTESDLRAAAPSGTVIAGESSDLALGYAPVGTPVGWVQAAAPPGAWGLKWRAYAPREIVTAEVQVIYPNGDMEVASSEINMNERAGTGCY